MEDLDTRVEAYNMSVLSCLPAKEWRIIIIRIQHGECAGRVGLGVD